MFVFKVGSYFLRSNLRATVSVMNGTFQESDAAVARDRIVSLSLLGSGLSTSSGDSNECHIVWVFREAIRTIDEMIPME